MTVPAAEGRSEAGSPAEAWLVVDDGLGEHSSPVDEDYSASVEALYAPKKSGWLIALFVVALGLSLIAGFMAVTIRSAQELAHATGGWRHWNADAYSCATMASIALVAWALFLGAAGRQIAKNKDGRLHRRRARRY